ncbi:MAG TPA: phage tail protein [Ideonella sp.]|uniref:phage tail protein n=1 Tax=Ideonella sp. TaxID=1929293 RepID=UPI002E36409D|nr:phage tail protein [Ideonella sp.]HEX5687844.1 phage tail protein [Ideonella sp.]
MTPVDLASVLYRQMPEVHRDRDNPRRDPSGTDIAPGDMARLLLVAGDLQQALYRTLRQRYQDLFPDQEGQDEFGMWRGCQPWVLPYLAQLLDVVPMSPLEAGQRAEIANAVPWRQRKGTTAATEQIAAAVSRLTVETQEGWRLVAATPRAGFARLPAASFSEAEPREASIAMKNRPGLGPLYATHPGLPNGTVDLRRHSRAVRVAPGTAGAETTTYGNDEVSWRQASRHGTPCLPDSYQDLSARSADLRTPDWRRGHVHPRRVVLHAAPFDGFFDPQAASVNWTAIQNAVTGTAALPPGLPLSLVRGDDGGVTLRGTTPAPVKVRGVARLEDAHPWTFENLWFDNELQVVAGSVRLVGCALRRLHLMLPTSHPVTVDARACLFKDLLAPRAAVALEYVTVLERLVAERLTASDSLLMQFPRKDLPLADTDVPRSGCVRFSRVPAGPPAPWQSDGSDSDFRVTSTCTDAAPVFVATTFGTPGCAVLHPATPASLRFGAEDGGEQGACHDLRYTLREQAVIDKLRDFMPVGMEPVLVPDASLRCPPPKPR